MAPITVSGVRILHTSDWHLGRTFHGVDLHDDQSAYIDHLASVIEEREIDALLVAGDVYDRSVPSVQTVRLLASALVRLSRLTTVILTPGNHDSSIRLGFAAELMNDNLKILADLSNIGEPVVLGDGAVCVYGIPYLDPDAARASLVADGAELPIRSHEGVLTAAMAIIRADLAGRDDKSTAIVMAHAFVAGGEASSSERDIKVGGVDVAPSGIFDGVDYVALGHLHSPQQITTRPDGPIVRYSGSPLAYSFSEEGRVKSSTLLDIADGVIVVTLIPTPVPHPIRTISGSMAEVLDPDTDEFDNAFLRVRITDTAYPDGMYARVKARHPGAVDIQHLPTEPGQYVSAPKIDSATDPMEILKEFVTYATGVAPSPAEIDVLQKAYDDVRATKRSA